MTLAKEIAHLDATAQADLVRRNEVDTRVQRARHWFHPMGVSSL